MNIEKYQVYTADTMVKDSLPLQIGENVNFTMKAGETYTLKLFIQTVSNEIAQMQAQMAQINKDAAQNGDACAHNCMTCEDREFCEKKAP